MRTRLSLTSRRDRVCILGPYNKKKSLIGPERAKGAIPVLTSGIAAASPGWTRLTKLFPSGNQDVAQQAEPLRGQDCILLRSSAISEKNREAILDSVLSYRRDRHRFRRWCIPVFQELLSRDLRDHLHVSGGQALQICLR